MSVSSSQLATGAQALERLVDREEVLQICYWYEGEGFGDTFTPDALETFLVCEHEAIEIALAELARAGWLEANAAGYKFTEKGRKEGGRLFVDGFADFQQSAHGECAAGCCDGDDHSQCGDSCILQ